MKPQDAYMTYEQIAKELGLSRQAVQLIEKQALKKLRVALSDWQGGFLDHPQATDFVERLMPYIEAQEYYDGDLR